MPNYCKAYLVSDLKAFSGWSGEGVEGLGDDDICYIWSDYKLTKSCFDESQTVLSEVTDDWKKFCTETLKFEPPADEDSTAASEEQKSSS